MNISISNFCIDITLATLYTLHEQLHATSTIHTQDCSMCSHLAPLTAPAKARTQTKSTSKLDGQFPTTACTSRKHRGTPSCPFDKHNHTPSPWPRVTSGSMMIKAWLWFFTPSDGIGLTLLPTLIRPFLKIRLPQMVATRRIWATHSSSPR